MSSELLKFLGVEVGPNARISAVEPMLRSGGATLWVGLLFAALVVASVLLYRRETADVGPIRRYTLAALRAVFLGLLLMLLIRPALRVTLEGDVRRQLFVLLDGTQSMSLRDARTDEADLKRAAIATDLLDPNLGLEQEMNAGLAPTIANAPREQLVRQLLTNKRLRLLEKLSQDYDVKTLSFGRDVTELVGTKPTTAPAVSQADRPPDAPELTRAVEALEVTAGATALGDAVREVISRSRGQPVAGVFVVTDGANNTGLSPVSAAQLAGQNGIPLYLWGVGLTRPRDLAVAQLAAPEVGFIDDEVTASVRLRTTGLEGQTATVRIKLGDEVVASQEVPIGPDGEVTVPVKFTPKVAGEFNLTAEVTPLPGEVLKDNNSQITKLRVVDGKIKVLYIETAPRWEFKYLQALLLRDRRADAKFLLLEASPPLAEGNATPYLAKFPATREELFKFDLVIMGDVDSRSLTAEQSKWLEEHVSKFGAGLVMIAGRKFSPGSWTGTALEKLIPVEWEAGGPGSAKSAQLRRPADAGETAIRPELTASGRLSTMMRLADTEAESASVWAKLPELYWDASVARAKPGTEVLVVDPDPAKASRFGKMPLIAVQQYGVGTAMFIGTDNLWRWRRNTGDRHYARLWGQVLQRLALPHLLGESKRTRLSSDRRAYSAGETATLYARLYSSTFEPVALPSVRGFLRLAPPGDSGSRGGGVGASPVVLRPVPDQPGMYRGETVVPAAGTWRFTVETDDKSFLELDASESHVELTDAAMNEALLREMARASGGNFLREEDIHRLPELIAKRTDRVKSTVESELWSSPAYFLAMLVVVSAEWLLRKGAMLK